VKRFRFAAARPDGATVRGELAATHPSAALEELTGRGLLALELKEVRPDRAARLPRRELAVFFRSLATLVEAGVPLDRALRIAPATGRLGAFATAVRERVQEGASLSAALAAQPGVPALAVGLVRAGEHAQLDAALADAATQVERDAELRAQILSALAYPVLLLVAGCGTIAVLVVAILPRFVALLGDAGSAVPTATRALLAMSAVIDRFWMPLGLTAVVGGIALARWLVGPAGHAGLLRLPVVGPLRLGLATARSARALSALLATGTPALRALDTAADAAGDHEVAARVRRAAERVRTGGSVAAALAAERAFDPQALELAHAGEASGRLAVLLRHGAALAETQALRRLQSLVRLIEPGLILLLGGLVAFVALALLQAVYGVRIR
jgi:type II secretory pathway component PulF